MDIKYKKDDIVYFIEDNKIKQGVVYSGYVIFNSTEDYKVYYYLRIENRVLDNHIKQELVFGTREELATKM